MDEEAAQDSCKGVGGGRSTDAHQNWNECYGDEQLEPFTHQR